MPQALGSHRSIRVAFSSFILLILLLAFSPLLRAEDPKTPPPPAKLPFVEGSWTLVLMPDTQNYADDYPGLFDAQTAWIARNKEKHNIQYVLHLGDVTDNGKKKQWQHAKNAMKLLDGHVPYAIALGNHDYHSPSSGSATTRETLFNDYFSTADFAKWPTYGGVMKEGELDNSYHLFSAGGRDWIVLALEWGPRDETVAWANEVLDKYPNRKAILVTHAYLWKDGMRFDFAAKGAEQKHSPYSYQTPGTKNDGEQLWNKLIRKHDFAFVFCGHISCDGFRLDSKNDAGKTTHQIMFDFQNRQLGGEAYLNLVEFLPDGQTVQVKTYSPLYNKYLTEGDLQYTLKLE
jgi:hypothetical protein